MKKVYAVKNGRACGLFLSWADCEAQVKGFPGAKFKSFPTAQEAMAWLGKDIAAPAAKKSTPSGRTAPRHTAAKPAPSETATDENADYIIYTDGSCLRNPDGPGGWAAVILNRKDGTTTELHKGSPSTTNNRMELSAAIGALSFIDSPSRIALYTDSQYMKNAFTKHWIDGWKRNGWKTATGSDVKNMDLWLQLDALFQKHQVAFRWVKGHAGIDHNERCDELARMEAMRFNAL